MEDIKTKALNRPEIDAYNDLTACTSQIIYASEPLERRLKGASRTGWRDLRLATNRLLSVIRTVSETIPEEKRVQLVKNARYCQVKLVYGPQAAKDPEMHLLRTEDLAVIISAASEQCKLCMGTDGECRSCQLGKAFDRTSWVSRGRRGWWEVLAEAEQPVREEEA